MSSPITRLLNEQVTYRVGANHDWIGCTYRNRLKPPKKHPHYYGGKVPFYKPGDLDRDRYAGEAEEYVTPLGAEAGRLLPAGTVLVTCIGNLGKTAILAREAIVNQQINAVLPTDAASANFLFYWAKTIKPWLEANASATTVTIINKGRFSRAPIAVPPAAEQHRIVAKLDSLSARSSRARHELDRLPKLVELYKQAILAKASGELTSAWRDRSPSKTTGSDVLSLIDQMRVSLLEGAHAGRRGPISDREAGRVPAELADLPPSWATSTLEHITNPTRLIQYGILKPGTDIPGGVPYVKVVNIQGGQIHLDRIRRTTAAIHFQYRRSAIEEGDILLSIRGTVGRLAFVPNELDGGNITQDSVRIDVLPQMSPKFVYWYLHSPAAQDYFAANQKGVAVRGINVGDVRPMEIPIPPKQEQVEIVTMIEHAFMWLNKIATEQRRASYLLPKLDQAILTKALRGELVPQDPDNEPAAKLLERIRAERANRPQKRGRAERLKPLGALANHRQ